MFAREDGSAPHPERLSKVFAAEAHKGGLPPIRFHDLRHTFATIALQAGVHHKIVSERPRTRRHRLRKPRQTVSPA